MNERPNEHWEDSIDSPLRRFQDIRVVVLGDVMVDGYIVGSADRVSPEAPVPVVNVGREWRALGGAANVAANCAAMGGQVSLVGVIGADEDGDWCVSELSRLGIDAGGVSRDAARPTTAKTRLLAGTQHVARLDREDCGDVSGQIEEQICQRLVSAVPPADVLVLQDYNKGVLSNRIIKAALRIAGEHGVPVIVDPKKMRFFEYGGSSLFKPNRPELEAAFKMELDETDPGALRSIRRRLGCDVLLVTLGEKGMVACNQLGELLRVPAFAREVYDVSGAGDTVTAVLALGLGARACIEESLVLASHAAAVSVGHVGARPVTTSEIETHVNNHPAPVSLTGSLYRVDA